MKATAFPVLRSIQADAKLILSLFQLTNTEYAACERCPAAQITGHFKITLDARKRTARLFQARIRAITACAGYGNALKTAPDSGLNFKASLPKLRAPARAS